MSAAQLETLVARIALYPDDLLAIVLPASTQPIQMVQAAQLLERRRSDSSVQPPKSWDPSVIALLNYPEVVSLMNEDLTWTQQLGTSVINQQDALLDAVQAFRKKARDAGNLGSDDKRTVSTQDQNQTIVIESPDPQVVYVPSYNPTTVVYPPAPAAPPPYYYSPPYPYYWTPGAVFFTGLFFGAAIGYGLSWSDHDIYHGDVNINRSTNINAPSIDRGNRIEHNGENRWRPNEDAVARSRSDLAQRGTGAVAPQPSTEQIRRDLAARDAPRAGLQPSGPPGSGRPGPDAGAVDRGLGGVAPGAGGAGYGSDRPSQARGSGGAGAASTGSSLQGQSGAFQGTNRGAAATQSYSSRGSASLGRSGGGSRPAAARGGGGRGRR